MIDLRYRKEKSICAILFKLETERFKENPLDARQPVEPSPEPVGFTFSIYLRLPIRYIVTADFALVGRSLI